MEGFYLGHILPWTLVQKWYQLVLLPRKEQENQIIVLEWTKKLVRVQRKRY